MINATRKGAKGAKEGFKYRCSSTNGGVQKMNALLLFYKRCLNKTHLLTANHFYHRIDPKYRDIHPCYYGGDPKYRDIHPGYHGGDPKYRDIHPNYHGGDPKYRDIHPSYHGGDPKYRDIHVFTPSSISFLTTLLSSAIK